MRRPIYNYFFFGLLAVVFYGLLRLSSPFLGALLAALVCAATFYPMHYALHRQFPKLSPTLAALLSDFLVFIFFVTPLVLIGWAIIHESASWSAVWKKGTATVTEWRQGDLISASPWMGRVRTFVSQTFGVKRAEFQDTVVNGVNEAFDFMSGMGTDMAKHAVGMLQDLVVMAIALFFFFRDGKKAYHYLESLIPLRHGDKARLSARIQKTVVGVVRGVFLTCLAQGIAATVGYFIVGAEGAILLGAMTAIAGFIPVIGTFVIWGPVSVFYLSQGAYFRAGFVFFWGVVIVVGFLDTLARPFLVSHKAEVPTIALLFAFLGGLEVWGTKGMILGPLLIAIAPLLIDMYRERYVRGGEISEREPASSERDRSAVVINVK